MGIGYGGKTLKEMIDEKEKLTAETGYYYGLKELPINEKEPVVLTRLHTRLTQTCINAKKTAQWIAGSPVVRTFGECLWMFSGPEGDVIACSLGLTGHIGAVPWIIRYMIDFEETIGIRDGDIFFCNDSRYGAGHPADCYNIVPVFYKGELVGWATGMNHIGDVGGAISPGSMQTISPTIFCDGFVFGPIRIGENSKTALWWERLWMDKTRTGTINVLDDKARTVGAIMVRDRILEVIEEFGIDYFRQAIREIVERERRTIERSILTETVPGIYSQAMVRPVCQKGRVPWMKEADRDWISHLPIEIQILRDGKLVFDLEGTSSEEYSPYNAGIGNVYIGLAFWFVPQLIRDTASVNTSVMYQIKEIIRPLGSMPNPINRLVGQSCAVCWSARMDSGISNLWAKARYARGVVEECVQSDNCGISVQAGGTFDNGVQWGFSDFSYVAVQNTGGRPYRDADEFCGCVANPMSDACEVEEWDLYQPPMPTIGKGVTVNSGGPGKFRSACGNYLLYMIYRPGRSTVVYTNCIATGDATNFICGASGGYPGGIAFSLIFHDTNMKELIAKGDGYPGDLEEIWRWIDEGKLKVGSIDISYGDSVATPVSDYDLFIAGGGSNSGWGDPIEREVSLVEKDLNEGYMTPEAAKTLYGVVASLINGQWKANKAETAKAREQMRKRRKERAIPFKQWWNQEREHIKQKNFSPIIYDFYKDLLKWGKTRSKFINTWQLGEDYQL